MSKILFIFAVSKIKETITYKQLKTMEILELVKTIVMAIAQLCTMLMLPMMVLLLIVYFSKWEESVKRGFFKAFIGLLSVLTCCVFLMFVIHFMQHIA